MKQFDIEELRKTGLEMLGILTKLTILIDFFFQLTSA